MKIKKWLIKINPFIGEDLRREKLWNLKATVKEVACHGFGKDNKYKNRANSVCYSLAPHYPTIDGKHHSFVKFGGDE